MKLLIQIRYQRITSINRINRWLDDRKTYSLLKELTGFATAAFNVWNPTVNKVIKTAKAADNKNVGASLVSSIL